MAKKLSFSIAVNLLTENFKKGANTVKNSLRSVQMQVLTFAAALGAGGLGLAGLISRFKDVARETSRVLTALKNVSNGTKGFVENIQFINGLAKTYGLEVNTLTGNFAKFTAAATQANMPMEQQRKVFESLSRASTAFALSSEDTNSVFIALSQMMGKGKISSEELRKQMGEKLPIAMQAMAKAAGVSMGGLEKLLKQGKLMSAEIIPKFAEALNEIIPNVDTNNLEASLNRLKNAFNKMVDSSGFKDTYKSLVDWLAALIESAGKNIQKIVVGIISVIAFAVGNSLKKQYNNYVKTSNQIVAHANKTSALLRSAVEARVLARKRLEDLEVAYSQASGQKQLALAKKVEDAKVNYVSRTAAARIALQNHTEARDAATNVKTYGRLAKLGAVATGVFKQIGSALKSMLSSFGFGAIIAGVTALVGHFVNLYKESKRVKAIFSDYKKEVQNLGDTQEIATLRAQLSIMNDKTRSQKEVNAAQEALQKMLGIEKGTQEEINKKVAKRIELIQQAARADFYAQKVVATEDKIKTSASSANISEGQLQELASIYSNNGSKRTAEYYGKLFELFPNISRGAINDINKAVKETVEDLKVLTDANKELESTVNATNTNPVSTTPIDEDLDEKAKRAAEKRLEALRKLDEADRQRQIDKQKFDIDMQQRAIDLLDDGFEKRTRQTLLSLKKENLEIEEYQNDLLKKQSQYLKDKYVSVHGTESGFEAYFKGLQSVGFKDKAGVSILPEGLRPEDIAGQVAMLVAAARDAQAKGLTDINKDLSLALKEQELMFASDLERKLAELDIYYDEQLTKAKGNAELIAQIESNRARAKLEATTDDRIQQLDFDEQLETELAAGLESIGMTELVEEKKLEITKKYLQLRIEALKESAAAGDEDAQRQIQLYEASLNKLNLQKPVQSLKSLGNKAIFNTIQKGFEKAGDSAEDAEAKTISLLGSISEKAGMIAGITSELQSMFGGLDESLDMAMETVGNIASGFANGGIVGGIMAVIGEGMKLFSKASEAAIRHQEALREIEAARLASQRAYNLLLLEQNLLLKEAVSLFGEKQIARAVNAINNYRESLRQLQGELKRPSGGTQGTNRIYDSNYQNLLKKYGKEFAGLAGAKIVTGHEKTGLFGWGKGRDVYGSILDEYDDVIDAEGKLNAERIQNILDTRKMSDETRLYLENLLNLFNQSEAALEELRNYLQSTFGALGDDLMASLENAILDRGINAWEEFGKAASKVIEQLGKQIAYELFFADKFKKLQSDLEAVYGQEDKSSEEIARDAMKLVGDFYSGIGKDMELAQDFLENWQKEAEKAGIKLWESDITSQKASTGGFQSMDQDTGNRLDGRFAALQMSGAKIETLMSSLTIDTKGILNTSLSISNELQKHTSLFNEMRTIQLNSFYKMDDLDKSLSNIGDILVKIDKNTSNL